MKLALGPTASKWLFAVGALLVIVGNTPGVPLPEWLKSIFAQIGAAIGTGVAGLNVPGNDQVRVSELPYDVQLRLANGLDDEEPLEP